MSQLTRKEIDLFSKKILEDYDANNPSTIFKDKMKINNSDALIIQSTVTKLREKRGEEVIGFKIGCVLKETQKKMGFTQPAWGNLWKKELYQNGAVLNKNDYSATLEAQIDKRASDMTGNPMSVNEINIHGIITTCNKQNASKSNTNTKRQF